MFEIARLNTCEDPRLSDFTSLTDVQLRGSKELAEGLFIAEGELVIHRALERGYEMRAMLLAEKWLPSMAPLAQKANAPVYVLSKDELQALTGFHVHRGALASMGRKAVTALPGLLGARRLAVLEAVNSHTNIGAIVRSAAALGVEGMLLSPQCADPLYRRAVRVSMGATLSIPWARSTDWPNDLDVLAEHGYVVMGLTPNGTEALNKVQVKSLDKVALVLGNEGVGLSEAALSRCHHAVQIPMSNRIDSLNVAAAAAVAFYIIQEKCTESRSPE